MTYEQIFNFIITIVTNHRDTWYSENDTKITINTNLIDDLHFDSLDISELFLDIENHILNRPVTKQEIRYLKTQKTTIETLINFVYQTSQKTQQNAKTPGTIYKSKTSQNIR